MTATDAFARVQPEERDVPLDGDRSLLAALLDADVPIAHACGGHAKCTTCRVRVVSGLENVGERSEAEAVFAERLSLPDDVRLACQTRAQGAVTLRRLVLDSVDVKLASRVAAAPRGSVGTEIEAAVLFADVAGFTSLSERIPAYDVMYLLNRWFFLVGEEIERLGGHIDNYMGDGLLAVFDKGTAEQRTWAAVAAGLAMLRVADDLTDRVEEAYGSPFGVRVGVHFGPLIAGTLGACHQRRETVIGDTVNVASRIEAANKEAGTRLLVSCTALGLLGDRASTGREVDVELKGKSGSFRLFEVQNLDDGSS